MGLEIQIQKWVGRSLWRNFQKRHPEVTDKNCKQILFNITLEFNPLLRNFPNNKDLKLTLQYILGEGLWDERYADPSIGSAVDVLYAIVNSYKLKTMIVDEEGVSLGNQPLVDEGSEKVCQDNEKKGMVKLDRVNEYCLSDEKIRRRLRGAFLQMPKCRDDLSKVGIFLKDKIQQTIQLIDKFLEMDDGEDKLHEDVTTEKAENYFGTQETIKRHSGSTEKKENRDPLSCRSVRFEATPP